MTTAPQGDTEPGLQVYLTLSTPHSSTRNQAPFSPSNPGEAVDESTANIYDGVWV